MGARAPLRSQVDHSRANAAELVSGSAPCIEIVGAHEYQPSAGLRCHRNAEAELNRGSAATLERRQAHEAQMFLSEPAAALPLDTRREGARRRDHRIPNHNPALQRALVLAQLQLAHPQPQVRRAARAGARGCPALMPSRPSPPTAAVAWLAALMSLASERQWLSRPKGKRSHADH